MVHFSQSTIDGVDLDCQELTFKILIVRILMIYYHRLSTTNNDQVLTNLDQQYLMGRGRVQTVIPSDYVKIEQVYAL